jgi:hypothetical protein
MTSTDSRSDHPMPTCAGARHSDDRPGLLLWSVGAMVATVSLIAFLLWGLNGAAFILDMIAAYCA